MVSFTVNLEVMSRVGAQRNRTLRWWHEMRRKHKAPVKTSVKTTLSVSYLNPIALSPCKRKKSP